MKKSSIRKTWNVISSILVALVVLLALLLVGARLFGLQVYTVLSGSMEPESTVYTCRPKSLAPTSSSASSTTSATRMLLMTFHVFRIELFFIIPLFPFPLPLSARHGSGAR